MPVVEQMGIEAGGAHMLHRTGAEQAGHCAGSGNGSPSRWAHGLLSNSASGIDFGQSQHPLVALPSPQSASVWHSSAQYRPS